MVGRVPVFWTLSQIMNIGHTCVIPIVLAMAEWNVDGDGESLIISTHIIDWWRPWPTLNVCQTATSPHAHVFFATPLRQFSVSTSSVLYCYCMLLWHCRG